MTRISLYCLTAQTTASPTPVLPDVGSITTLPFFRIPRLSASSIIDRAIRSLMLPPGFARSSFIQTSTFLPKRLLIRTSGVPPIVSKMFVAFTETSCCCRSGFWYWKHLNVEIYRHHAVTRVTDAHFALMVHDGIGRH